MGILALRGSSVSLTRSHLSDHQVGGIVAFDSGTTLTASEIWLSDTKLDADGKRGIGMVAGEGASLSVTRSWLSDHHTAGVLSGGSGTEVTASEVWVSGTKPDADNMTGMGLVAIDDGSLTVSLARVSQSHSGAIAFFSAGGSVTESLLEDTQLSGDLTGDGLVTTDSVVTVERIIARGNTRAGVLFDKSEGELSGSLITQNALGLAHQGLPGVVITDDNVVKGNEQERIDDGALKVPIGPMALPELPEGGP